MTLRRFVNADAVAEAFDLPKFRVYELTRQGVLPHCRIGRQIRYDIEALNRWAAEGGTRAQPNGGDGEAA